ncbi:hypothetical protein [Methylobacter psychrophilus]|uniref:hypothetical protein n=1 Tax=Methylobacter psychrophilus TaxID=96941 RepID=UPI0021D4B6E9|nr:hypothetical protein [Methylobacter psychrophilus]
MNIEITLDVVLLHHLSSTVRRNTKENWEAIDNLSIPARLLSDALNSVEKSYGGKSARIHLPIITFPKTYKELSLAECFEALPLDTIYALFEGHNAYLAVENGLFEHTDKGKSMGDALMQAFKQARTIRFDENGSNEEYWRSYKSKLQRSLPDFDDKRDTIAPIFKQRCVNLLKKEPELLEALRNLGFSEDTASEVLAECLFRQFPEGKLLILVWMPKSGLSSAITIIIESGHRAPVFIKMDQWRLIQQEESKSSFLIRPRLPNFVSASLSTPARYTSAEVRPLGIIALTVVGSASGRNTDLQPLETLLREKYTDENKKKALNTFETLATSFWPQQESDKIRKQRMEEYKNSGLMPAWPEGDKRRKDRPLWQWLGVCLPVLFEGKLCLDEDDISFPTLTGHDNFPEKTRWILAEADLVKLRQELNGQKKVCRELKDFILLEVDDKETPIRITLAHPALGVRFRIQDENDKIAQSLSKEVRLGTKISLTVGFDSASSDEKRFKKLVAESVAGVITDTILPEDLFLGRCLPFSMTFDAVAGPIHGDLNLQNILFSENAAHGWLIDHAAAEVSGMVAFDFAKLEVELFNHLLLPAVWCMAGKLPDKALVIVDAVLDGLLNCRTSDEIFKQQKWQEDHNLQHFIDFVLKLRGIACEKVALTRFECALARAAYGFVSLKFLDKKDESSHRHLLPLIYRTSQFALVHECHFNLKGQTGTLLERDSQKLDAELIRNVNKETRAKPNFASFVRKLAEPASNWPIPSATADEIRGDVASTGGAGNISPIINYLWLMARHRIEPAFVAPKISSKGNSGGTVDILQSGGYPFTSDKKEIAELLQREGGLFCEQNDDWTRQDKAMMVWRKRRNLMKHGGLVLASILAKKIPLGVTDVGIDIKLGDDNKMLRSTAWYFGGNADDVTLANIPLDSSTPLVTNTLAAELLCKILLDLGISNAQIRSVQGVPLVEADVSEFDWNGMRSLRLLPTNGNYPQCRVIGRQLMLIHLECLLGEHGHFDYPPELSRLYLRVWPTVCGLPEDETCGEEYAIARLRAEWAILRQKLSRLDQFPLWQAGGFHRGAKFAGNRDFDHATPLYDDLLMQSYTLASAQGWDAGRTLKINTLKMATLDDLFQNLSKQCKDDEEIGFWLHALPGETLAAKEPFITVFYRLDTESGWEAKLKDFLREQTVELTS